VAVRNSVARVFRPEAVALIWLPASIGPENTPASEEAGYKCGVMTRLRRIEDRDRAISGGSLNEEWRCPVTDKLQGKEIVQSPSIR